MIDTVRVEKTGPVTTVLINRPEARNAVDGAPAAALADAFRAFEDDDTASVAVLGGVGPAFCAGADMKSVGTGRRDRLGPGGDGDGPIGPPRLMLSQPVGAAVQG